jgi:D-xylonolactonase
MGSSYDISAPEVVVRSGALLGEGPIWVAREQALYWVDIKTPSVWRLDWATRATRSWTPPWRVGAIAPRLEGGFIAATEAGFALADFEEDIFELIGNPEEDIPGNRFNDGKVDPAGCFWAGTMDDAEQATTGALYRLDAMLEWQCVDHGYHVTNGPAFSPDGRILYHSDSAIRTVYRFPIAADGSVGARETFLRFDQDAGYPDGMTSDIEGCLWIAFWDGGCVRRFSPEGVLLDQIDVPTQRPTSCAFGGPEFDRLFITSARIGLDDVLADQPLAGSLFMVRPSVGGVEPPSFAG